MPSEGATRRRPVARRFRESTHLIPTPGVELTRPKEYTTWILKTWPVLCLAVFKIVLGVAIEILLAISQHRNGYSVPQHNIFTFVQASFLLSFFPTLLLFPLAYLWQWADYTIKFYQPYVALATGGKRAEESLLIDYVSSNVVLTLWNTLKRREWIVHFSIVTSLATLLYVPLAGSLLSTKSVTVPWATTLHDSSTIGLIQDVSSLNAFLAAAGFTEAAAFQQLPDPPFVRDGWATAPFQFPDQPGVNASLTLNTTGIRTNAGCSNPSKIAVDTSNTTQFTITASTSDGCTGVAHFNPSSAEQQYGTAATNNTSCGLPADEGEEFAPVMFWFFHKNEQGQGQPRAVICRPDIELFNIQAEVDLNSRDLEDVIVLDSYTKANNVSGDPLDGKVYNAVLFGSIPTDQFVQARATAIGSQIPGAIFRLASQNGTQALQTLFDDEDGFLPLASTIYTQHLSVSAKTVYFVGTNDDIPAIRRAQLLRLFVDPLAAHALAILLMLIGLSGIGIHLAHRRVRRALYLTTFPGNIGAILALTSHSGFGSLLYPFDDDKIIRQKLSDLRFSLDRRTGAIIADEIGFLDESEGGEKYVDDDGDADVTTLHGVEGEKKEYGYGYSDVDPEEKLSRLSSGSTVVTVRGVNTPQLSPGLPADFPYEHEPLVVPGSRDPSLSPGPNRRGFP